MPIYVYTKQNRQYSLHIYAYSNMLVNVVHMYMERQIERIQNVLAI